MIYEEIRPKIRSGDVIAFSHDGWRHWSDIESQLVRIFTRSEFTHVAVAWVVGQRVFLIEAVVPRVRIFPLSKFDTFFWLPVKKDLSELALEAALSYVGMRYSKLEAIKGYLSKPEDSKSWQCAELVKDVLMRNDIVLSGKATPSAVVKELMSKHHIELITVDGGRR